MTLLERRLERTENHLDKIEEKFNRIDKKFDKIDDKFDKVDEKFDKMQTEIVGALRHSQILTSSIVGIVLAVIFFFLK